MSAPDVPPREHNAALLRELGPRPKEIETLEADGVIVGTRAQGS